MEFICKYTDHMTLYADDYIFRPLSDFGKYYARLSNIYKKYFYNESKIGNAKINES